MLHSNVCQPMTKWYSLMCYRHIHPSVTCMLFELSEWFLDPWKVNKASSDSPVGEFSSILLNSNAEMSITCYLKLKIEIEEMNWVGASAQKSLMFRYWLLIGGPIKWRPENITWIFSGFVHIHSKRKLGDRTILLAGKSAGYTEATVKLKVQSYKQRENEEIKKSANQKMEMTVIQPNYQSEVLKLFAKNQQKMIKRSNDTHAMVRIFAKTVTLHHQDSIGTCHMSQYNTLVPYCRVIVVEFVSKMNRRSLRCSVICPSKMAHITWTYNTETQGPQIHFWHRSHYNNPTIRDQGI